MASAASATDLRRIIQADYLEMPGLHLTEAQMRKLWGLDPLTCARLLAELLDTGFLRRTSRGSYVRNRVD